MSIKEIRVSRKLTQQNVADKIGCSAIVYSRYECGTRQPPIDVLLKLADVFGVTVDYLLGRQTITDSTLSSYEIDLIEAARESDERAREDALSMLKLHSNSPNKKESQE